MQCPLGTPCTQCDHYLTLVGDMVFVLNKRVQKQENRIRSMSHRVTENYNKIIKIIKAALMG